MTDGELFENDFSLPMRKKVLRARDFPNGPPLGPSVCGIDEAGRGPLAGPVYAAAVVLDADFPLDFLDDSKALSERRRLEAFSLIVSKALAWAVDWSSPSEIGELNILGASLLAMRRAYMRAAAILARAGGADLESAFSPVTPACGPRAPSSGDFVPALVYVDGNQLPDLGRPAVAVIKGDSIVPAIMAASILAKVARDRAMERFDWLYPEYGYARHKGYPTEEHRKLVKLLGPSPIQRPGFRC